MKNEKVKFPIGMLDEIPALEQRKLIYRIVTLFFEDQIRISEKGELLFSKTGINKLKKIFIDVMVCADLSAMKVQSKMEDLIGKAEQESKKSVKERARAAGLVTVEAQMPKRRKLIL